MSQKRLSMRKIDDVLRLAQDPKLSHRQIAKSLGISKTTVAAYLNLAREIGAVWPLTPEMRLSLETRVFEGTPPKSQKPLPYWPTVHLEIKKPGVTLQLLWEEYVAVHPDGYRYTQFCHYYREWARHLGVTMRQDHVAGEKMFVDYSGDKFQVVDPETGEAREVELFVAVLGASSYTYVEATWTQTLPDWLTSHIHAFEYFGGVPQITVPDNLKSGVTKTCRYEPDINPAYHSLCVHYGCAVIPARPYKPRDKAKVEVGVLFAQRWILAVLRHRTFFSLAALNIAIREALEKLNSRRMQKIGKSRREMYVEIEKAALKPLPAERYVLCEFKTCRVNIDYHIEVEGHYYSVPYTLRGEGVEARFTRTSVEVFHHGGRVASHVRSRAQHRHTTTPEHMPKSHQKHAEWTPSRLIHWGETLGGDVGRFFEEILKTKPHPEQGFRSCLGIMRLTKVHGKERLKQACSKALALTAFSYRTVKNILTHQLEALSPKVGGQAHLRHGHVRGASYYDRGSPEEKTSADPSNNPKEGDHDARRNDRQTHPDEAVCDGEVGPGTTRPDRPSGPLNC